MMTMMRALSRAVLCDTEALSWDTVRDPIQVGFFCRWMRLKLIFHMLV